MPKSIFFVLRTVNWTFIKHAVHLDGGKRKVKIMEHVAYKRKFGNVTLLSNQNTTLPPFLHLVYKKVNSFKQFLQINLC